METIVSNPMGLAARAWKIVLLIGVFFAAMALGRGAVFGITDGDTADDLVQKLRYFDESGADYDVVFIGSSRVFRGFDATSFDKAMADRSYSTSTFNFGTPGMRAIEMEHVLSELVRDGDRFNLILMSPEGLMQDVNAENIDSTRVVAWHDVRGTATALQLIFESSDAIQQKLSDIYDHLNAFLLNLSALGRAVDDLATGESDPAEILGQNNDGFVSLDETLTNNPTNNLVARRDEFLADPELFATKVSNWAKTSAQDPLPGTPTEMAFLERLVSKSAELDAQLVIVLPPASAIGAQGWLRWAAANDDGPFVINMNDPAVYPELFDPALWFDEGHLNRAGAELFGRLLADALADQLDSGHLDSGRVD